MMLVFFRLTNQSREQSLQTNNNSFNKFTTALRIIEFINFSTTTIQKEPVSEIETSCSFRIQDDEKVQKLYSENCLQWTMY
jgi:hypothetical protein